MTMPGSAPSIPASHAPDAFTAMPFSNSRVSSPKYHTLPSASWAYQSNVSSMTTPSSVTVSRTTTVSTPMTSRVSSVTSTTIRSRPSGVCDSYTQRDPGVSGRYG